MASEDVSITVDFDNGPYLAAMVEATAIIERRRRGWPYRMAYQITQGSFWLVVGFLLGFAACGVAATQGLLP